MEYDLERQFHVDCRLERPGRSSHFKPVVTPGIRTSIGALLRGHQREMPGLMQEIARIHQTVLVDDQHSAIYDDSRQKGLRGNIACSHNDPDAREKLCDAQHNGIAEAPPWMTSA